MKKNIHYISIAAAFVAVAAMIIGCKPNVSAAQDTTAPAEVTELKAVAGNGKISLSWVNPADADLYQVEISVSPAAGTLANSVYLFAEKGKAMSFTAEGLTNGTAYTFTVKTIDKSLNKSTGVSTAEAVKPIDTSDKTPPAEVTNLNAVSTGNSKISVSWTSPADADLYQVEITVRKEDKTVVSTVCISAEKGKDSGYIVEGLAANTTYTVTVKTIDKSLNKSKDGVSKTVTTKAAGSVMSISLSQSPAKDTKTNGTVMVTVESSTSIKEAKWKKGAADTKAVLESGTAISGTSFTASENGIYSVAVLDNDGRREVETIKIENIDKTPPAKVTGLAASYSSTTQKIMVNWLNPADSDFAGLTLSWKKADGEATNVPLEPSNTSYEILNIATDESSYTITVITKDDVGNTGAPEEKTVKATATAEITEVILNRTHLDTKMTDRGILVTITGSNFDKLTSLLVQVTDGSTNYPPVTAAIDTSNTKATATVQAPVPSYPTDEGTRYTVKAIVNNTTPAAVMASFIVSNPAKVSNIALTPAQLKLGSATKVSVAVTGTNFNIRGVTKIKLLDSKGDEVSGSTVTIPADRGTATAFSAEIPLPTKIDFYTVAVYFDEVKESKTSTLQLYGAPEITSISIPKAGTPYAGNKLPVTIKGKNFTAPVASFSGSGASITNFTVVNDATATAEVTCPYSAGEHTVTVMCGTESNTGTISVKDYSAYTVGKIVLADKTPKSKDDYTAITPTNPPVGIICGDRYGVPRMIALHTGGNLQWAAYKTTGYNTYFKGIICTPSQTGVGAAQTATFTDDSDGSDNWEYIKAVDPAGAADAATNYPAFDWVNQYNTQYVAQLGGTNFAWYMPSLAELCEVYKNRETINTSLEKIHGLNNSYADSTLGDSSYWSSSQSSVNTMYAWKVYLYSGFVDYDTESYSLQVCCLAGF